MNHVSPDHHSIVPYDVFLKQFGEFTNNCFEGWEDWKNMIVLGNYFSSIENLGGSVVASILPVPADANVSNYFLEEYPKSDIDIFLMGLTPEQAKEKISLFRAHLENKYNAKVQVVRTPFTLTLVAPFPTRHIQVFLNGT